MASAVNVTTFGSTAKNKSGQCATPSTDAPLLSSGYTLGVLVDVSRSMESAYIGLDRSRRVTAARCHAIITAIMSIVKSEFRHHDRQDSIFITAFGLSRDGVEDLLYGLSDQLDPKSILGVVERGDHPETCDLISLLECTTVPKYSRSHGGGYQPLIDLATLHKCPQAERWIRKYLSEMEARLLYSALRADPSLIPRLYKLMPSKTKTEQAKMIDNSYHGRLMAKLAGFSESDSVHKSEAYKFTQEIITDMLKRLLCPKPRSVQYLSELLDDLLGKPASDSDDDSLHDEIQNLLEHINPYIYGYTPMCQALRDAESVFREADTDVKVLFLLSDGMATDGDPREIARELRDSYNVTIMTCFLTSDHIDDSRRLYDENKWDTDSGQSTLFEMSSTMPNTHTPVSYLVDAGWTLPPSGVSRLFTQANSLDVIDEICRVVVSQLTKPCDAIVDVLGTVPLATYINARNAEFSPKEQEGVTCYANATAAVFHLAMQRIVGRKGGVPGFYIIRDQLIHEYGVRGATTQRVLQQFCPIYRLRFNRLSDEVHARQAINERRPVLATFMLYRHQWTKFNTFYERNPKGVLNRSDVSGGPPDPKGHAVVLTRCNPDCLVFMNSQGESFADGGFFRVKNKAVLDMTFFDIYWNEDDLTPSEKRAFKEEAIRRGRELAKTFPSLLDLVCKCPLCKRNSRVGDYSGNILEAVCPKCRGRFEPKNEDLVRCLYNRNM